MFRHYALSSYALTCALVILSAASLSSFSLISSSSVRLAGFLSRRDGEAWQERSELSEDFYYNIL